MRFAQERSIHALALPVVLLAAVLAAGYPLQAESAEEDLSDNETCLDCHMDEEQIGVLEVGGPQVHNPDDNSLIEEAHNEVACIDCHADIEEIPHRGGMVRTVDCLACHESVPK
jgi:nitrate/TMAO reductase-like tetraheme cytochrome c subunit